MNDLGAFRGIFDGIKPWAGWVPQGFDIDFLGTLTDISFRPRWRRESEAFDGQYIETSLPTLDNMTPVRSWLVNAWRGELWFEAVNWFVSAREAKDRFVMITLGAWHGAQAVGCYQAVRRVNQVPCRLVCVEPMTESFALIPRHLRNNGIDPDHHWLLPVAINGNDDPVLFALGSRAMGPQNCFSTNHPQEREGLLKRLIEAGQAERALEDLLLRNSTGAVIPGANAEGGGAEIKLVSAVTLADVLGPFDTVDYLDSDIQQSEVLVFPPFMDLLKRKVRRIHIGTHGKDAHQILLDLFLRDSWEIVFNYAPDEVHETVLGTFRNDDGVLTVRNPAL